MQLQLFRLVLNRNADLFAGNQTREEWLRELFSERFEFIHRNVLYHYVPIEGAPADHTNHIFGRIGRPKTVKENEPPESGLDTVYRDSWTAAYVVIDPRHHNDGQKIAFQADRIGDPLSVLRSVLNHLNARISAPYTISVNPISAMSSFVDFLERHPNDITFIQFDLNAPNMFGVRTDIDSEMKAAQERFKAKKARIVLSNKEGMTLDHPRIREMAEYATTGGGEIKAKTKTNDNFRSRNEVKNVNINVQDDINDKELLLLIINRMLDK